MTDEKRQVEAQFPYIQGMVPIHANATLVNGATDGNIIIDFGFIDPLLINLIQKEINENEVKNFSITVHPLQRISISQSTAEQLIFQIQNILEIIKLSRVKEENE